MRLNIEPTRVIVGTARNRAKSRAQLERPGDGGPASLAEFVSQPSPTFIGVKLVGSHGALRKLDVDLVVIDAYAIGSTGSLLTRRAVTRDDALGPVFGAVPHGAAQATPRMCVQLPISLV